jgi:hypothetical protein
VPQVGHGQFGLRDDIRIFDQLKRESSCRTDAFVEIEGGALINDTWTAGSLGLGPDYSYAWSQEFDGELLEVSTVRTLEFPTLVRKETQAQVTSTAGSWAYDSANGIMYVHLPDDSDPTATNVLVTTTFNFGTAGAVREHLVQPYLGTDYIVDGDFDNATLADWTISNVGAGFSAVRSATPLVGGGYSALLAGTGAASGSSSLRQIPDTVSGNRYRYFGYYQTSATQPSTAGAYVQVDTTALSADGINQDASLTNGLLLTPTFGRTRAFLFDHIAPASGSRLFLRLVNSAATACSVTFDRVSYKPIHGWRLFHPRIAAAGIPESEQGSLDVYPGSAATGSGSVTLMNDEAATFERIFSSSPWTCLSRDVRIRYGGAFMDNGQEILWDDMFIGQAGIVAGDQFETVTDEQAIYTFEDARNPFEALLPDDTYGDHYNCEDRDIARPRARFFGTLTHIRPSRVDQDGTTLLGVYEVNDATYAVGNAMAALTVYAYVDEEAAEANDTTKRKTLVDTSDYTKDLAAGTFEITRNPGVFVITAGEGPENSGANDRIDFVANSVTYEAALTVGIYTADTLRAQVESSMEAASSGAFTVTYSNTTHKFTIQWDGAGNFQLLADTGANKQRSTLNMLGYTNATDYTTATSYVSTTAVFTDPDAQNFIRCDATGYLDDASGTYTGTANAPVELGPDIFRYVLGVMLHEPTSRVDIAKFETARTACPQELGVYLGNLSSISEENGMQAGAITVQQLVDRLEISGTSTTAGVADIRVRGDGVWEWINRASIPDAPIALYERDFLSWEGSRNGNDPYGFTRVNYAQDPSTGRVLGQLLRREETMLLDRRQQIRTFDSYLLVLDEAGDACEALSFLTRQAIRHFRLRVKGALLGANPGDLVTITRSRALQGLGETGGLDADVFRILYLKKDYLSHVVEALVHTNITS